MSEQLAEKLQQPNMRRSLREMRDALYRSKTFRGVLALGAVAGTAALAACGPAKPPVPHRPVPIARCYDKPQPARTRSDADLKPRININLAPGGLFTGDTTPSAATTTALDGGVVEIVETYVDTDGKTKQQAGTAFLVRLANGAMAAVSAGHNAERNDASLLVAKDRQGHTSTITRACYMRENVGKFVDVATPTATQVDVGVYELSRPIGETVLTVAESEPSRGAILTTQGYGYKNAIPAPNNPSRFNVLLAAPSNSVLGPVVLMALSPPLPKLVM